MAHAVHEPETHELPHAADAHAAHHDDPNTAPMHHDIKEYFGTGQTVIAGALGLVAIAAGIIFGLIFTNS